MKTIIHITPLRRGWVWFGGSYEGLCGVTQIGDPPPYDIFTETLASEQHAWTSFVDRKGIKPNCPTCMVRWDSLCERNLGVVRWSYFTMRNPKKETTK